MPNSAAMFPASRQFALEGVYGHGLAVAARHLHERLAWRHIPAEEDRDTHHTLGANGRHFHHAAIVHHVGD